MKKIIRFFISYSSHTIHKHKSKFIRCRKNFTNHKKGWLTSVSGIVKTYIKARLNLDQSNKDSERAKSLATVSPIRMSTNPFVASQPVMSNAAPLKVTSSLISSSYDRHRSPDPPPRTQRGNQSPLILRKKLEAAGSPLMQRR